MSDKTTIQMQLARAIRRERRLTSDMRTVIEEMADFINVQMLEGGQGAQCWPSVATLIERTSLSPRTVKRARMRAVDIGILIPMANTQGGRAKTTTFLIDQEWIDTALAKKGANSPRNVATEKGCQPGPKGCQSVSERVPDRALNGASSCPERVPELTPESSKKKPSNKSSNESSSLAVEAPPPRERTAAPQSMTTRDDVRNCEMEEAAAEEAEAAKRRAEQRARDQQAAKERHEAEEARERALAPQRRIQRLQGEVFARYGLDKGLDLLMRLEAGDPETELIAQQIEADIGITPPRKAS